MRFSPIICCLLLLFACDQPTQSESSPKSQKRQTDYVIREGLSTSFSVETLAMLAKTTGKPMAFEEKTIAIVDDGLLYQIPIDSALSWLEKPSYFRNPKEKLKAWLMGDAPETFSFDMYDPYPDTYVDSISLQHYRLYYDYENMRSEGGKFSQLDKGHADLVISNQSQRTVRAMVIEADVKKRLKSGANCVIESYKRDFLVEESIPPLSQITRDIISDSLTVKLKCNGSGSFEMPYKATFTITRYQLEGDSIWQDALKREIIAD